MKKYSLLIVLFLLATAINAQTGDTAQKVKPKLTMNLGVRVIPANLSSLPAGSNSIEFTLSPQGNDIAVTARGVKTAGVKGCNNCNITGKLIFKGNTKVQLDEQLSGGQRKYPGCIFSFTNEATGKSTDMTLDESGSFSGTLDKGTYNVSCKGSGGRNMQFGVRFVF